MEEIIFIQKSIELFDDDDPCIIHKSYVIKGYVDQLMDLFHNNNTKILYGKDLDNLTNYLNSKEYVGTFIK